MAAKSQRKKKKREEKLERKRKRKEEKLQKQKQEEEDLKNFWPRTDNSEQPFKRQRLAYEGIDDDTNAESAKKIRKVTVSGDAGDDFISFGIDSNTNAAGADDEAVGEGNRPFYGLLTTEQQLYYNKVDHKLTIDDFESAEDKAFFVSAIYEETKGSELKVACSRACSRTFQKLMLLMTSEQIHGVFEVFLGNLNNLVNHRFGSHCCETVFLRAAQYIDMEADHDADNSKDPSSLQGFLLKAAEELEPNVGYLATDKFASHAIRVLLLVLSEEPLEDPSTKVISAKKRREKIETSIIEDKETTQERQVSQIFKDTLKKLITAITSGMDTSNLRVLATHPIGNPVLQLLIRIELASTKKSKTLDENSMFRKLLPDESLEADTESAKFVIGLLYDQAGSRLVEILIQKSPAKIFKKLYNNILKERMGQTARNEIASYVNIRVLERLGKDELNDSMNLILPEVPKLIAQRRTAVIKTLINRSIAREADLTPLANAIKSACGDDTTDILPKLLHLDEPATPNPKPKSKAKAKAMAKAKAKGSKKRRRDDDEDEYAWIPKPDVHGSLLAQAMLQTAVTATLIQDGLLAFKPEVKVRLAKNPITSRLFQAALTSPACTVAFKRLLVASFLEQMVDLSTDPIGSYLADLIWGGTNGQHFMKERFAQELADNEERIRDSSYGRIVWRNWSMDLYRRKPAEWQTLAKGKDHESIRTEENPKSAIELAREREYKKKERAFHHQTSPPIRSNAIQV